MTMRIWELNFKTSVAQVFQSFFASYSSLVRVINMLWLYIKELAVINFTPFSKNVFLSN